jgi:hypothetical protein
MNKGINIFIKLSIFIVCFILKYKNLILFQINIRALSLIGRALDCQLRWSQFESGRARLLYYYIYYK